MAMRAPLLIFFALLWPLRPAVADCGDGVAALISITAAATDPHVREVLMRDLKQAQLDLWEFDEVECAMALEHAARFLRRQGGTTNADIVSNPKN
jgi:hypothetical protein